MRSSCPAIHEQTILLAKCRTRFVHSAVVNLPCAVLPSSTECRPYRIPFPHRHRSCESEWHFVQKQARPTLLAARFPSLLFFLTTSYPALSRYIFADRKYC